jgi:O-antigen/teichoic acid export membrane protein
VQWSRGLDVKALEANGTEVTFPVRAPSPLSMGSSSFFIMASVAATSGLGFLYWVIEARLVTKTSVGIGSSAISAVNLTSLLASLGLGALLVQRLPGLDNAAWWRLLSRVTLLLTAVAVAAGIGLTPILAAISSHYRTITSGPVGPAVLAFFVLAQTFGLEVDALCLAERRADLLFAHALCFSLVKLACLPFLSDLHLSPALAILLTWSIAQAMTSLLTARVLLTRVGRPFAPSLRGPTRPPLAAFREISSFWFLAVGGQIPTLALPVVVLMRGGPSLSASFYVSWTVGASLFIVSSSAAQALVAEGRHSHAPLSELLSRSLKTIALVQVPGIAFMCVVGPLVVRLFGRSYTGGSASLIRILAVAAIFDGITNVGISVARIRNRIAMAAALNMTMAVLAGSITFLLVPSLGLAAGGWGYLGANAAGSVVVVIGIYRVLRRSPATTGVVAA